MIARALAAVVVCGAVVVAQAQEFRAINPIRSPRVQLPPGAQRVTPQVPVAHEKIEAAVHKILASWNTPELAKHLAPDFYDRDRLLDNLNRLAPRDARLRVIGIQGVQVLEQYLAPPKPQDPSRVMVTTISVTVRTQIEFNDATGFKRLDGTNEFIVDLPERVR